MSILKALSMSSIEQMNTLIESLSFAEKLSLNERLAGIIRKEGGGAAGGKKRGPKAKIGADGEPKPKRKAALGTLAWMAYVKHIKDTQPEALEGHTKEAEKLAIIKGIRAEDPEGYNTFVAEWKEEHKDDSASVVSASASASDAEGDDDAASQVSAPASVVKPLTASEKIAALKAAKASASSASASASASSPAAKPVVKATEVKVTPTKATKPAATTAPKKEVKSVKSVKTAKAVEKVEEPTMATLEIDGVEYWHDPSTNYLWEKTGKSTVDTGEGVGYYQPDNAEEPIRVGEFGEDA